MAAAAMSLEFLYKTVEILECSDDLKRTCRGIFKQTAWAAGGTIAGGLIAGPPGALLGCCVGDKKDKISTRSTIISLQAEMIFRRIHRLHHL